MAEIIVFEDDEGTLDLIDAVACAGNHEVVAQARSIHEAHALLARMALGDIRGSYTLLDGTLNGSKEPTPDFIFQPTYNLDTTAVTSPNNSKAPAQLLDPIIVPAVGNISGQHGRQISEAIRACNIPTKIIGISSIAAEQWSSNVDYDVTKLGIGAKLLKLIQSLESARL